MAIQGTPFVELNEIDVQSVYKTQRVEFYLIEIPAHQIIIGKAQRLQDKAAEEAFARVASDDRISWNSEEIEGIEGMLRKQQLGRAEEWILSRIIKKRGVDVFFENTSFRGTPFTSVSHSKTAVVVSLSDVPVGIDHETVEPRNPSWALKMDPDHETIPLGQFLGAWRQLSKDCIETITSASKEASMKAWGINRLGLLPGIKISGTGNCITTRALTYEKKEVHCQIFLQVDVTDVLTIALFANK